MRSEIKNNIWTDVNDVNLDIEIIYKILKNIQDEMNNSFVYDWLLIEIILMLITSIYLFIIQVDS